MQDRFKFRVFSTTNNKYTDIGLSTALAANSVSNQFVIQQCLGVKDKNNRLIYEGDIVKWTVSEATKYYKKETITPSIGEILWSSNAEFFVKSIVIGAASYKDLECEDLDGEESLKFYCPYEGDQEFNWNELEVIASVADNKLIDLEGNVISTLTNTEDMLKLLNLV